MEKTIAILTKERKYAERLSDYLNRRRILRAVSIPFSSIGELFGYSLGHRIKLLIADRQFSRNLDPSLSAAAEDIDADQRVFLTEASDPAESLGSRMLRKYQSADGIARDIAGQFPELCSRRAGRGTEGGSEIIGVYSPIGRSGKTSLALALARELAGKKRTLFISLDEFAAVSRLLPGGESEGVSELFYLMKQGRLEEQNALMFVVSTSGFDWLPPVSDPEDQAEIGGDDYLRLVEFFAKSAGYGYIVIDMNRYFDQASLVMDMCGKVYIPAPKDPVAGLKLDIFLRHLEREKGEPWMQRTALIEPPPPSFAGEGAFVQSLGFGDLGDYARELAHEF